MFGLVSDLNEEIKEARKWKLYAVVEQMGKEKVFIHLEHDHEVQNLDKSCILFLIHNELLDIDQQSQSVLKDAKKVNDNNDITYQIVENKVLREKSKQSLNQSPNFDDVLVKPQLAIEFNSTIIDD